MDIALRPRVRPFTTTSRYGSLTLAAIDDGGAGDAGSGDGTGPVSLAESVVTASVLPAFASGGPVVTSSPLAGFAAGGSVVTALAGFGGAFFPQPPGGRKPMPAAFK